MAEVLGDGSRGRRSVGWLILGLVVLVAASVAGAIGVHAMTRSDTMIQVTVKGAGGQESFLMRGSATVADVVARAGISPRDGNTISAKDGTVLGLRDFPASYLIGGAPATPEFPLFDGAVVQVLDGEDRVEETEVREQVIPAPGYDGEIKVVHRNGIDGLERITVGVRSGEVIEREVVREPVGPQPVTDKVVALTFDDGPDGRYTPEILRILAEHDVVATFCVVGEVIERTEEYVHQIVDAGHALCNHTWSHDTKMKGGPRERVDEQVGDGVRALTSRGFEEPPYYRAPGGFLDDQIRDVVGTYDEVILDWTVDTRDWEKAATADSIMRKVEAGVQPGAIILLHDGGGERPHTVTATARMIEYLKAQGYGFVLPTIDP